MKILIVALNYAPEMVGCAKYTSELSEKLVSDGHSVRVICAPPYYPQWKIAEGYIGWWWRSEKSNGVDIVRAPLFVPKKVGGVTRLLHLFSFGLSATPTAIWAALRHRPDLVLSVAPTLVSAPASICAGLISGAKKWLHIQDFEVDAAFDLGLLKGGFGRKFALAFEAAVLRSFDRVSTISPAMLNLLKRKGVRPERISELRNWVDIAETPMLTTSRTDFRKELKIESDRVVALYSGNMAAKQGIEMLGDVARIISSDRNDVDFIFCGAGPARKSLEEKCHGLKNVKFLPLQPLERLPELLGTADIHLLPQRPEAADLVLPSKLTGMLASGRPIVAMAQEGTGLWSEVEGCGLAVEASPIAMAEAISTLAAQPDLRQRFAVTARRRAEERWDKMAIVGAFEADIAALIKDQGE